MKTLFKNVTLAVVIVIGMGFISRANATTFSFGDSYYMGSVNPGEPSSPTDEAGYINYLNDLAPGTSTSSGGYDYIRSSNTLCYNTCTDATATGSVSNTTGTNTGDFGSGYLYLLAKYDGPNGGDLIWYVAGLTGSFTLPTNWGPDPQGTQYGISHWALFDPNGSHVPEPASLLLLGTGLASVAYRLKKRSSNQA